MASRPRPRIRSAQAGKLRTTDSQARSSYPAHLGEQAGGGGPPRGVFGQAALDQRPRFGRHPVKVGGAMYHAVQQRRCGPGAERALARGGEGEDRPQAEDVARRPDFVSR